MLKRTYLLSSIALIALPAAAHAQEAPQPADDAAGNEIVVTGTAGGGVSRQAAAFAITSISADAIEQAAQMCIRDRAMRAARSIRGGRSAGPNVRRTIRRDRRNIISTATSRMASLCMSQPRAIATSAVPRPKCSSKPRGSGPRSAPSTLSLIHI